PTANTHAPILAIHPFVSSFSYAAPHALPSSPTRRSSDLHPGRGHREHRHRRPRHAARRRQEPRLGDAGGGTGRLRARARRDGPEDRKSTRLNSSHVKISYAVFCLKKKVNPTALSPETLPI